MSSTLKHRVRANAGERRKRSNIEHLWRPVTAYVDWVILGRSERLSGVEGCRVAMLNHSTRSRVARSRATPSYRVLVIRMTSSVAGRCEMGSERVARLERGFWRSRTCSGRTFTRPTHIMSTTNGSRPTDGRRRAARETSFASEELHRCVIRYIRPAWFGNEADVVSLS